VTQFMNIIMIGLLPLVNTTNFLKKIKSGKIFLDLTLQRKKFFLDFANISLLVCFHCKNGDTFFSLRRQGHNKQPGVNFVNV